MNMDYLQPILNSIIQPLIADGALGVPNTLRAMQDYYLTRDDLDSLLELCSWPGQADPMAKIDSKVRQFEVILNLWPIAPFAFHHKLHSFR